MSKDTVIILKSINYSEADKILTVFGKERGKFVVFAKGIRKISSKNRSSMQTLYCSDISFYEGRGLPILTESSIIYSPDFDVLKNRLENIERVLLLMNKVLVEEDPHLKIFNILKSVIKHNFDLENCNKFRVYFLREMGFLEDLRSCSNCDSKDGLEYIDSRDFRLVCNKCVKNSNGYFKIGDNPYNDMKFTIELDKYIKRVIEEI